MLALIPSIIIASIMIPVYITEAQEESQDRIFIKSFCSAEDTLLSDLRYTNGQELSYDSSGCPESIKVVHRWNELSTSDQIQITNRLATQGYTDRTAQIQAGAR